MESVEEALLKLEELLQELHVSSSSSGKEQLKAACSDLERIRKLKKEAEFLEASFRAKADSLQQVCFWISFATSCILGIFVDRQGLHSTACFASDLIYAYADYLLGKFHFADFEISQENIWPIGLLFLLHAMDFHLDVVTHP